MKYFFSFVFLIVSFNISSQIIYSGEKQPLKTIKTDIVPEGADKFWGAEDLYLKVFSGVSDIRYGKEYISYYFKSKSAPLLNNGRKFQSTLFFSGRRYDNVTLQYDTFLDEVIYPDSSILINYQFPKIILNKSLVESFILNSGNKAMLFRNLKFTGNTGACLQDGYYEIVYDGITKAIIKHKSVEYNYQAVNEYKYKPEIYLNPGAKYIRIKNNKDLIKALGRNPAEVKIFLEKAGIKIKNTSYYRIAEVLKYYDSLITSDNASK